MHLQNEGVLGAALLLTLSMVAELDPSGPTYQSLFAVWLLYLHAFPDDASQVR